MDSPLPRACPTLHLWCSTWITQGPIRRHIYTPIYNPETGVWTSYKTYPTEYRNRGSMKKSLALALMQSTQTKEHIWKWKDWAENQTSLWGGLWPPGKWRSYWRLHPALAGKLPMGKCYTLQNSLLSYPKQVPATIHGAIPFRSEDYWGSTLSVTEEAAHREVGKPAKNITHHSAH